MNYEEVLIKNNLEVGKKYKCKLKAMCFAEEVEVKEFSVSIVKHKTSPLVVFNFGNYNIYFADPKITTDSTDREAIKDSLEDLQFEYTYDIKLVKQFKEKVNS